MHDFLKFFDEKVKTYPMHLEIYYSRRLDWVIHVYRVPETITEATVIAVSDPDMELCFAKAHVALKEWLLKVEGGY